MVKTGPISPAHRAIMVLGLLKNSSRCPTRGTPMGRGRSVTMGGAFGLGLRRGRRAKYHTNPNSNSGTPTTTTAAIMMDLFPKKRWSGRGVRAICLSQRWSGRKAESPGTRLVVLSLGSAADEKRGCWVGVAALCPCFAVHGTETSTTARTPPRGKKRHSVGVYESISGTGSVPDHK